MTVWKKAMSYLGLGPDDVYDDYDVLAAEARSTRPSPADSDVNIRPVSSRPSASTGGTAPVRYDDEAPAPRPRQGSAVRAVPASQAPHTVRPRRFDQAQEVADTFKEGQPVIMNLQDVDRDLARRLIDFGSGLCYALGGKLDKVANGVYLLTPGTMPPDERRQLAERGDYD